MNQGIIVSRYARALFESAKEKKALEIVFNDIDIIYYVAKTEPEFDTFLMNPVLKLKEKKTVLKNIFEKNFHNLTFSFLNLLVDNRREAYLQSICLKFTDFFKEHENIKTVELTTASIANDDIKKKLLKMVEQYFNCKGEIRERVKEDIIGGFVLRVDDKQFDASVSTRLKNTKSYLLNTQVDE